MQKITVIGAGSWGCSLAMHLAREHAGIHLWDIDTSLLENMQKTRENTRYLPGLSLPEALIIEADLSAALKQTDLVLIVVPSHVFAKALASIKPHIASHTPVIWASKGIAPDSLKLLHEVAHELLGARAMAALSGPSFAREVAEGLPTILDMASNGTALSETLHSLFDHGKLRLHDNPDFISVQLGGAMKNVVAIAVGMADGLGMGTNAKCALMTIGLQDEMRMAKALGADSGQDLMSFSGVGDLILTCTDNQSRNRRFGKLLGEGQTQADALAEINQTVEGLDNCPLMLKLAEKHGVELKVTHGLQRVLSGESAPDQAIQAMLGFI
ncbi:MAG: glycerol-3-phosphate dehydrogenase [Gammaproteobacteria bacterium CG11_big_fil_rev_8_21_14_0_20_46_22]|nr:MAG: glycerol-3-phosphate dehydrogenase [Gammaproteobacteria bacterium CG12_big_fil_rev_8_21_14_0_65_46_12]PIR10910.1 MAG: glycerol-3-phosphate dehydrogenase [Gammaproteobacteria bacterium CG11_big_fil_rev_8_21_14_0_20_46_22]